MPRRIIKCLDLGLGLKFLFLFPFFTNAVFQDSRFKDVYF